MSIEHCDMCDRYIDTDWNVDHEVECLIDQLDQAAKEIACLQTQLANFKRLLRKADDENERFLKALEDISDCPDGCMDCVNEARTALEAK